MTTDTDQDAASFQRYLADQVGTSSPAQRLLMLFDQLRRDLHRAERGYLGGDLKEISDHLVHAQEVICALRDPLDLDTDLGRALSGVYGFCLASLVDSNLRKDPSPLLDVQAIIDRLADANRTAFASLAGAPATARAI